MRLSHHRIVVSTTTKPHDGHPVRTSRERGLQCGQCAHPSKCEPLLSPQDNATRSVCQACSVVRPVRPATSKPLPWAGALSEGGPDGTPTPDAVSVTGTSHHSVIGCAVEQRWCCAERAMFITRIYCSRGLIIAPTASARKFHGTANPSPKATGRSARTAAQVLGDGSAHKRGGGRWLRGAASPRLCASKGARLADSARHRAPRLAVSEARPMCRRRWLSGAASSALTGPRQANKKDKGKRTRLRAESADRLTEPVSGYPLQKRLTRTP